LDGHVFAEFGLPGCNLMVFICSGLACYKAKFGTFAYTWDKGDFGFGHH
jgi:hypothetical protein